MSHHRSDLAGAASASNRDVLASPSAQQTPISPSQAASQILPSSKDSALSEKYKKLKRRFFELEEETSTELQRSSERNVRMREERNMLLDRIIELEAQSQQQNETSGSPTSPSFPRTLMNPRARTSFIENLRQTFAADDADDDVKTVSTSWHVARKDERQEDEVLETKRLVRRSRASYPPSGGPMVDGVDSPPAGQALTISFPSQVFEEAHQIAVTLSDTEHCEEGAPVTFLEGQPGSRPTRDLSMPPTRMEVPCQSPVSNSVVLSNADLPNVDQQTCQISSDKMTSHNDAPAIADVAMVDGTSHEANGGSTQPPVDRVNVKNHANIADAVEKIASDEGQQIDKENIDTVPDYGGETTPQGKTRVKRAAAGSTRGKKAKTKGSSARAEAEQSASPQTSRRSARLARSEVPTENQVGTQQAATPGFSAQLTKPSTSSHSERRKSIHAHTQMLPPEKHSASASPPPLSEPVTEAPSPSASRHNLDVIDPLLKHTEILGTPPPDSAAPSQQSDPAQLPPSPSMANIVKVATAVIAAQNAARTSQQVTNTSDLGTESPSTNSLQARVTNSGAASAATAITSPGPISSNPYLALSAIKPGGSPVGMPPMMPPMNPYSLYYPTPGTPGASPYPYPNPYYYMAPMAGPSTAYSPPPSTDPQSPSITRSSSDNQRQAKPKRLKAHTVTSKQFSIPMVPRDNNAKPMLPLNVGIMTVINLGTVCMREHFHTERYIFPVGYEVTRRYMSTVDPNHEVVYHCTILDGGDGPKFQIIPADAPDRPVIAGTATGAWSTIVKQANAIRHRQHSNSVSGPDFFGLGQNTIKHLIQQLPNADRLRDYVWQHFVEGGPLGGRHAAVIPALPDEYENILPIGALQYQERQKHAPPPDSSRGLSYYPQHIIQQAQQERLQQAQRHQSQQQ
ncbi:hypothetical protein APHAL10511_002778 [Amanita phalloides]|nr:hypothetical protein APHAL10511_002778 [Amanita phalloides]